MSETTNLALPFMAAAQAQKHITYNETMRLLDVLVQTTITGHDQADPPAAPVEGAAYTVSDTPTGVWSNHGGDVAIWQDNAWRFLAPRTGWLVWDSATGSFYVFNGANWIRALAVSELQNATLVGINTQASSENPLTVAAANTLFTHSGGSHRVKVNKAATADTASVLFQNNYAGRAEFGLQGDDNFRLKVSADGGAWSSALEIDAATAKVRFPVSHGAAIAKLADNSDNAQHRTALNAIIDVLTAAGLVANA